jgi:phosphatidylserine/phosphatidylglycerophosphate/cardiolipin synthase-like enzyme
VAPRRGFTLNAFDNWLQERSNPFSENVEHLHTKFMLVDPLGADPWVITGSANFSEDSTRSNDENMLVIRGNRRVADIYLGEFMRTYNHIAYRAWAEGKTKKELSEAAPLETGRDWIEDAYKKRSRRTLQREYFCP